MRAKERNIIFDTLVFGLWMNAIHALVEDSAASGDLPLISNIEVAVCTKT